MFNKSLRVFYAMKRIATYNLRISSQFKYPIATLRQNKTYLNKYNYTIFGFSIFTWLGFEKPKTVEDDLILNIKWSILLMQRKDFLKSEQLLHIALRMAQQVQNEDAITYIYDVMANLALEVGQYEKAKKLFVSVMQRLLEKGVEKENIKNIHISIKLARCCHLQGEVEKSGVGFRWSIKLLEDMKEKDPTCENNNLLLAQAKTWYGLLMFECGKNNEALKLFREAYNILIKYKDDNLEQIFILLNDMATVSEKMDDLPKSEKYLLKAIQLSKLLNEMDYIGVIYVNLGRIYLKQGIYEKARKHCGYALNLGRERKNDEIKEEAQHCLDEVFKVT